MLGIGGDEPGIGLRRFSAVDIRQGVRRVVDDAVDQLLILVLVDLLIAPVNTADVEAVTCTLSAPARLHSAQAGNS